jgi:1-acyl-sn-glycerol-3-phosphate acyltransferase/uncharacterized protein with GYD domain
MVLSKLSGSGCKAALADPTRLAGLADEVEAAGGKIVEQYALIGPHDFLTIIDIRDNDTARHVFVNQDSPDATHTVMPGIDFQLFTRLLARTTENTGPYRWQISLPARAVRRVFRRYAYTNTADRYFQPLTIIGTEHFDALKGPALFIANHTSFMDGPAMFVTLPDRYRGKTAYPAAADRFFVKGRRDPRLQGWWFSLVYNSFPLQRGGGRSALAHADWLLDKGWSIGIFPEGARTSAKKLARFRMGPAILAISHGVPVVPMYMEGLGAIRPKGTREMTPGPVTVRVGAPIRFPAGADVAEATRELHRAVDTLGREAAAARHAARDAAEAAATRAEPVPVGSTPAASA